MNRNYEKVIAEYDKRFGTDETDLIYMSDLENVITNNQDLYNLVCSAMKYGCIIGYRRAKNEQYKKNSRTKRRA